MAKAAKASSKAKTAKKPAKPAKVAAAKAKPAAKPSKAAAAKVKPEAKAKAKPAAPAKPEKAPKAAKEKKSSSPAPTIMSGAPQEATAEKAAAPAKPPKPPKLDKAEARKARRAAKDLLAGLERLADARAKWEALYAKASDLVAEPYKMSGTYEPRTAIMHKILGWGYILSSQNDRLEVLFKDGVKMLISNYKTS